MRKSIDNLGILERAPSPEIQQQIDQILGMRSAAQLLLDYVDEVAGDVVEMDKDYFWSIASAELYDVYRELDELTVGQVSESLGWLRAIADERSLTIGLGG